MLVDVVRNARNGGPSLYQPYLQILTTHPKHITAAECEMAAFNSLSFGPKRVCFAFRRCCHRLLLLLQANRLSRCRRGSCVGCVRGSMAVLTSVCCSLKLDLKWRTVSYTICFGITVCSCCSRRISGSFLLLRVGGRCFGGRRSGTDFVSCFRSGA